MRFVTFVKTVEDFQGKPELKAFWMFVNRGGFFPQTSDPTGLALFLYDKLNEQQTKGYLLFMMLYYATRKNMLRQELKEDKQAFLDSLNLIVTLQQQPDILDNWMPPPRKPRQAKPKNLPGR